MNLIVSSQLTQKLAAVGDQPILDSEFVALADSTDKAEKVQGQQGWYISSPVDGWLLHGPFA